MKKSLIVFLALFALTAASCGPAAVDNHSNEQNTADNRAEHPDTDETARAPSLNLPEYDLGGAEMIFLVRGGDAYEWDAIDIYAEAETGEPVNDIIYKRNRLLEQKYNTALKEIPTPVGTMHTTVSKVVKAGDSLYSAVIANAIESFSIATADLVLDLCEVPHIGLDRPWWDGALNKNLSICAKQFYAASAANVMAYEATWIAMFNKKMLTDNWYDPANIYEMVKNGTWTLDNYTALTKDYVVDVNNDAKMNAEDRYGTSGQGSMGTGFYIGAGLRYVEKDENDNLIFKEFDERAANLLEKVTEICKINVGFNSHGSMNNSGNPEYGRVLLAENRALFFTETLLCVRALRDMANDFGVVPMPKYDEEQEKYISLVHHWAASLTSVPANCPDAEAAGIILEEMAYQSKQTVLPVYFDIAINGKYLRDDESVEMIDYIMENRVIDLGVANDYGNLDSRILDAVYKGNYTFSSIYEKNGDAVRKKLENIMAAITG
ncbi:MAG: hypothetical protein FWD23_08145 [Oscillospiraceae bacterium]|nr:hypothetical protein [Oscillospiraceae bacterium]